MKDFSFVRASFALLVALCSPACGATVSPGGDSGNRDASVTDASRTCRSNSECGPSEMCDGPSGCGVPWTCVPSRACPTIAAEFCACDYTTTFYASPGCVGRPYAFQGPCESPPISDAGPGRCTVQTPDEVRAPMALYCDQSVDITLRQSNVGGCGCTITPVVSSSGPTGDLSVCNCCDACDCRDGIGEASIVQPAMPCRTDPAQISVAGRSIWILPRPSSAPATPIPSISSAVVQGPRSTSGPALWWVHLQGTIMRCASSGVLACVSHQSVPDGSATRLELHPDDCSGFDCDGPTHPVPFDTWHSLGELTPGSYVLVVPGLMDTAFNVGTGP